MKAYVVAAVFGQDRAGGLGLVSLTALDERTAIAQAIFLMTQSMKVEGEVGAVNVQELQPEFLRVALYSGQSEIVQLRPGENEDGAA